MVWNPAPSAPSAPAKDGEEGGEKGEEGGESKNGGASGGAGGSGRGGLPFVAAITLAEAESIRRVIHQGVYSEEQPTQGAAGGMGGLHQLIPRNLIDSGSSLALLDGNGRILDKTPSYLVGRSQAGDGAGDSAAVATHLAQCVQVLRFYNNEMYYTAPELKLLLAAMGDAPHAKRELFFAECLRRRRRERRMWADTPLAKVCLIGCLEVSSGFGGLCVKGV